MAQSTKRGNSFLIRVSCGYDARGKQVIRSKTWRPDPNMTPKQIEKELNKQMVLFEEECFKGQASANIKFEKFAEQWFKEYAEINLKPTSLNRMTNCKIRVYPAIGHITLDKMTTRHIQRFINDLLVNGRNIRNGDRLARKTVIHHLTFISDVFGYAVKMGMLTDNPCKNVSVPSGEKKEKDIYTVEEVEKLLELLQPAPIKYRVFFTLALYSGFRRGELLGLEWKDIDWQNNIISVRRTSNYAKGRGMYTDTTKTEKSKRTMKFPQLVMDLLKDYKSVQDSQRMTSGTKWTYTDRLFVQNNGLPMFHTTPYIWMKRYCDRNNFKFCDIHSLRHFYASSLISEGVDVASVSSALGHSVIGTTTNIYCHAFQQAQAKAAEAIANVLDFSKNKKSSDGEKTSQRSAG